VKAQEVPSRQASRAVRLLEESRSRVLNADQTMALQRRRTKNEQFDILWLYFLTRASQGLVHGNYCGLYQQAKVSKVS
jgi:hypothetical protein